MNKERNLAMEAFNQEISELLHRQQVLESIKAGSRNEDILSNAYAKNIISQCRHHNSPLGLLRTIPVAAFIAVNLLFAITVLFFISIVLSISPNNSDNNATTIPLISKNPSPDTTLGQAELAMTNGDYDTARSILTKEMAEHPYGPFSFIDYSILCHLEGNQDEAAIIIVNFINDIYGTQNISSSNNYLYRCLLELTGPFSPDVGNAYTECLTACEKSIENFKSLDSFIKNKDYDLALQLCDSMQQENTTAAELCKYYRTCYMNLGEYEYCAAYFLSFAEEYLAEEWPPKAYPHLSLSGNTIQTTLTELKPYVSAETQEKIDAACLLLEQD